MNFNFRRVIVLPLLLTCALTGALSAASRISLHDPRYKQLASGEILFADVVEESDNGIEATFLLHNSAEQLWRILTDYENYDRNFENIEKIKIIEENSGGAVLELWISTVIKTFHYKVYRHHVKQHHKLTWRMISGDFKTNHGSWEMFETSDPNTSLIKYRCFVEIEGFMGQAFKSLTRPETLKRINRMVVKLKTQLEPVIASGKRNMT